MFSLQRPDVNGPKHRNMKQLYSNIKNLIIHIQNLDPTDPYSGHIQLHQKTLSSNLTIMYNM